MNAIGATDELSMRVSVATLVRVLFENPRDGELMLALERRATLREANSGHVLDIRSQPFGGAIRIRDLDSLRHLIETFHFDSERSRAQQDFRLFIRPSSWPALRDFCYQHITRDHDPVLETGPQRELAEEFEDALRFRLSPAHYTFIPLATFDESEASPTENIYAPGYPTVRIYRVFEAVITDASVVDRMLENSRSTSAQSLSRLALEDARNGGKGKASAVLALAWKNLHEVYRAVPPSQRNAAILFGTHRLDSTLSLILDGLSAPRFQRL